MKRINETLDAVERASARSASLVHSELKRGLSSLASIAATAPFVGLSGTVLGIFNAFRGGATEKTTLMYLTLKYLSDAMVPTALGLVVALLAFCCYRYLQDELEHFDFEMRNASLQLISELARLQKI